MFCPNCGTNIPEGANACPNCGTFVNMAQPVPEAPVYQEPVQQAPVYQEPVQQAPVYQAAPVYAAPVTAAPVNTTPLLVFGILALAFACSFYLAVAGIVFGIISKNKVNAYLAQGGVLAGKAKVGRILGKVGLIVGIVMTVLLVIYIIVVVIAAASFSYYY